MRVLSVSGLRLSITFKNFYITIWVKSLDLVGLGRELLEFQLSGKKLLEKLEFLLHGMVCKEKLVP